VRHFDGERRSDQIRGMFGAIASRYDFLNHLLSLGIDKYWRWRTVNKAPPNGDGPILDVCAGTGDLALAYARRRRSGGSVFAADFCRPMLAIGTRKAARANIRDIVFLEADTQQLPFASDRFQIVSVAFGIRNVTDTDRGLREMARVCRPGGRVAVLEFSMPTRQPFKSVYAWYFRHVLPRIGRLVARQGGGAYNYLPASVGEFPSGQALADRMRAAGLREVRYYSLTFGVATLYVGIK
jgi:demethylmenaquinone methyltransferase/2-methoxy-6-polyprenyl-1,4-benzoquinol methylase